MAYSNGYYPASALGNVPGSNAGLLKPAALAYTAMHYASLKETGVSLHLIDGSVGRTYRSYSRQLLAKRIYGSNAATPGSSNHGFALATDLMTPAQRSAIDRVGRRYGWAKEWSDASWEWWHLKWRDVGWKARPDPLVKLGVRQKQAARTLLYRRQQRKAEGRTGHGRRWRRWDRAVNRSYRKVERLHRRASGTRKAVLKRVLEDRDGRL